MSPDIIYIYDLTDKKNVYSNDGIKTVLGYSVDEIQDMGDEVVALLMHPDDMSSYTQTIIPKYASASDSESIVHKYRMKHKSGEWRWLKAHEIIYQRESDGTPRLIFGIKVHDITNAFRAFRKEVFDTVNIESGDFAISPEFAIKAHLAGFKLGEVPTTYTNRKAGKTNFKMLEMGLRYLSLTKYRFRR